MLPLGSSEAGMTSRFPAVPSKRHASRRRQRTRMSRRRPRLFRVPPSSGDHDPLAGDLSVAGEALADDVDIVEPPLVDRQNGGVTNVTRFESDELRALQCKSGT